MNHPVCGAERVDLDARGAGPAVALCAFHLIAVIAVALLAFDALAIFAA